MDLSRIEIIGAFALLTFSLYPVLHGDVNLLTFWELVVTLSLSSGFTLLFLGTKSELEKTRIKINVITENKTTTYKEELKVSSIIFKNVVYYGNKKIQNGKIELMIKGLWDRFERPPSWETINIDPNQTYSQPICQLFKNRDYAEIILGEVDPEKYRSLPNILKKDHIYDVSVKFCKDEQEETIHCFKIDTSWENFGLKLAC